MCTHAWNFWATTNYVRMRVITGLGGAGNDSLWWVSFMEQSVDSVDFFMCFHLDKFYPCGRVRLLTCFQLEDTAHVSSNMNMVSTSHVLGPTNFHQNFKFRLPNCAWRYMRLSRRLNCSVPLFSTSCPNGTDWSGIVHVGGRMDMDDPLELDWMGMVRLGEPEIV